MIDPILRVNFPIQRRALDIDIHVRRIEVFVANGGGFPRLPVFDADFGEERGRDEVDVLAGVGKETKHAERDKGAHGWGRWGLASLHFFQLRGAGYQNFLPPLSSFPAMPTKVSLNCEGI